MIDALLSQLRKVRKTAPGEWVACCPAHEDRNPSLAVKDNGDGRILCYCHAGCSFEEIVSAVGLSASDLLPPKAIDHSLKRIPFNPRTVLSALGYQAMLVATAASMVGRGEKLSLKDKTALFEAAAGIQEAISHVAR